MKESLILVFELCEITEEEINVVEGEWEMVNNSYLNFLWYVKIKNYLIIYIM